MQMGRTTSIVLGSERDTPLSGGMVIGHGTGGNPGAYASYPAPSGFRWEFVTDGGVVVTDGGIPVVDLVGA